MIFPYYYSSRSGIQISFNEDFSSAVFQIIPSNTHPTDISRMGTHVPVYELKGPLAKPVLSMGADGDEYGAMGFPCNPIQRNGYVLEA